MKTWNRSDLNAIVAACRTAARRVLELCDRFGTETYLSTLDALLDRNYRAMAQLIRTAVPTERLEFTDYVCDDGRGFGPYKIHCSMQRVGDKVVLDFAGTDPQAEGSINFYLNENMLKMFFGIYMIMVFDPQILWNDGFYPLVEVNIPEGSLLKPRYPAALSCRTHALGRIFDVMGGLLGQRAPEFLCAAGFSSSPHLMYSGVDRNGEWFQLYQIGFGGIPGRPFGDGPDGHSLWPSFTNVPNEFLESYFPLVIERYQTVADSGGPGFFRGGNGIDITYRFLEPGEVSIHDDRWFTYPFGVNGGLPGARSRKLLRRTDGTEQVLPSKCDHVKVGVGDTLQYMTWGGGGWGDPFDRDPALVALEVDRGLVSREGALRYGVVLTDAGAVDEEATKAARTAPGRAGRHQDVRLRARPGHAAGRLRGRDRPAGAPAARVPVSADDYRRAGFGGRLEPGDRPALLVVDFVRAYLDRASPLYAGVEAVLASAARVLEAARAGGVPVVFTRVSYQAGGADGGLFYRKVPALEVFQAGSPLGELPEVLAPGPGELVVTKQYASAFFGTSLAASLTAVAGRHLRDLRPHHQRLRPGTAVDALQHGFVPLVVGDAVGDRDPRPHQASLFDLAAKYAEVVEELHGPATISGSDGPPDTLCRLCCLGWDAHRWGHGKAGRLCIRPASTTSYRRRWRRRSTSSAGTGTTPRCSPAGRASSRS